MARLKLRQTVAGVQLFASVPDVATKLRLFSSVTSTGADAGPVPFAFVAVTVHEY